MAPEWIWTILKHRIITHICRETNQVPSDVKLSCDGNESARRKVQNTKLPIVRFPLPSCFSLSLTFRYAPQHVVLDMTIRGVAHLSRRRPWFDARTVRVEFEVDRAAVRRVLLRTLRLSPRQHLSIPCHKT